MTLHIRDAAEKIKADSGGRIEIQLFPNNVLGGDTAMLSQLRSGPIQFLHFGDNILQTLVPVAALIETAKLYEVQKYCSLTNHIWNGFWFLANDAAWKRLPKNLQEIVERRINEAALKQRADSEKLASTLRSKLTSQGLVFNQPDTSPFRAKLQQAGFYKEWKDKFGDQAWSLLEKATGTLA